jgi:hypothetical protein
LGQLVELLSEILIMPGIIKYTNVRWHFVRSKEPYCLGQKTNSTLQLEGKASDLSQRTGTTPFSTFQILLVCVNTQLLCEDTPQHYLWMSSLLRDLQMPIPCERGHWKRRGEYLTALCLEPCLLAASELETKKQHNSYKYVHIYSKNFAILFVYASPKWTWIPAPLLLGTWPNHSKP